MTGNLLPLRHEVGERAGVRWRILSIPLTLTLSPSDGEREMHPLYVNDIIPQNETRMGIPAISLTRDGVSLTKENISMVKVTSGMVKEIISLTKDTSAMVKDTSAMVKDTSAMVKDTSAMVKDTSAMVKEIISLTKETSAMVKETPSLVMEMTRFWQKLDAWTFWGNWRVGSRGVWPSPAAAWNGRRCALDDSMAGWLATLLRPGTGALRSHFRLSRGDERRAKIILRWSFGAIGV